MVFTRQTTVLILLISFYTTIGIQSVQAQRQRREVSWVNPKLPEGRGLEHKVLISTALGHDVGYVVWTPANYDSCGNTRYPVTYFLHGMGGNESADAGGFSSRVAQGIRDGVVPPALCVFPNGGRSGYTGEVETMLVDELIPLIDRDYATKKNANSRASQGSQWGEAVRFDFPCYIRNCSAQRAVGVAGYFAEGRSF